MPTRRFALIAAPAAILLAGGGAAAWVGLGGRGGNAARSLAIGGPFTLVDGNGKTVTDRDFRGRWTLIYFGYTHCPDACPTALQDMANAVDMLGAKGKQVNLVFITVDPARDTPAAMKEYVSNFDAPFTALSGTAEQVAQAAHAFRVYYAKHPTKDGGYEMDHSSVIYVMNPDGEFVTNFTHESSPQQIADRLKTLV